MGGDFDATGCLSRSVFDEVGVPRGADVYLCGPTRIMAETKQALATLGVQPELIHVEIFTGSESMTPGKERNRSRSRISSRLGAIKKGVRLRTPFTPSRYSTELSQAAQLGEGTSLQSRRP
jgi:ferredoxin-NADP reductase